MNSDCCLRLLFLCFRKDSLNNSTETPPLFLKPALSCLVVTGKGSRHIPSPLGDILLQAFLQLSLKTRLVLKQIKYWLISFYLKWTHTRSLSAEVLGGSSLPFFPSAFLFVCFPNEYRLIDFTNFRIQYTFTVSMHLIIHIYRKRQNLVYLLSLSTVCTDD